MELKYPFLLLLLLSSFTITTGQTHPTDSIKVSYGCPMIIELGDFYMDTLVSFVCAFTNEESVPIEVSFNKGWRTTEFHLPVIHRDVQPGETVNIEWKKRMQRLGRCHKRWPIVIEAGERKQTLSFYVNWNVIPSK